MKKIILVFLGIGIFLCGVFAGIIIENIRQSEQKEYDFHPVKISEISPPVVTLFQIENGVLKGEVEHGDLRIFVGEEKKEIKIITSSPEKPRNFSLNIQKILPMLKRIPAPEGSQFVASKRGKKYYALDNPRAFLVSSKNRIFFTSKEAAEKNGYSPLQ